MATDLIWYCDGLNISISSLYGEIKISQIRKFE